MPCSTSFLLLFFFVLTSLLCIIIAQQAYPPQWYTTDCNQFHPENAGYLCSSSSPSCNTLAYFRVQHGSFTSLPTIANTLFNTTASSIASASSLPSSSSTAPLSIGQGLFIPLNCSCSGNYSSHNITYTIVAGDLFVTLANSTYEGLTTCQAIQYANPTVLAGSLSAGQTVVFPLRCACPSQNQTNRGIKLLLTYPVATPDDILTIVNTFGVTLQEFLSANDLNSTATLFPGTTVLVPLLIKPTVPPNATIVNAPSSQVAPPSSNSSKTGIYIGVPVAAGILALILGAACFIVKKRKTSKGHMPIPISPSPPQLIKPLKSSKLLQDLFAGISMIADSEKLTTYTLEELKQATHEFSPSTQIRGGVYRGVIKGQVVAVKVMTRNVTKELQILQKVHHANLVTLLGACVSSRDQSYLVYEYAENGSLSDWLHDTEFGMDSESSSILTWNNRLQVALDVATALEYIHEHTNPSFVHRDIKSSNILLDSKFRGKLANFGLAKSTEEMEQGSTLTRHVVGTQGYLAPEYITHGMVSPKMDVYALGVVLLEILSGEEATMSIHKDGNVASTEELFLSQAIRSVLDGDDAKERLKRWMDVRLQNAYPLDCAYSVAVLARSCVVDDPATRPSTRDIAYTLAKLLETSLEWEPYSSAMEDNYRDNHLEAR